MRAVTSALFIAFVGLLAGSWSCGSAEPETACTASHHCPANFVCRLRQCEFTVALTARRPSAFARGGDPQASSSVAWLDAGVWSPDNGDASGEWAEGAAAADAAGDAPCAGGRVPSPGDLVLNEILASVPAGEAGDANGDGVRDAFGDEFVELVNAAPHPLELRGVQLGTGGAVRLAFPRLCLGPMQAVVVFGGIAPGAQPPQGAGFVALVATRRLSLGNERGNVFLLSPGGEPLLQWAYERPPAQSITRSPDITGLRMVPHTEQHPLQPFSPGTCADGTAFQRGVGCAQDEDTDGAGDVHPGD